MSEQQQPAAMQALVDAIDLRARQAGNEGATAVLRGLLGTVSDTLASIEARLASLEQTALTPASAGDVLMNTIDERLQALNARLGRLEEAFVRAVDDSSAGTVSISERVVEAVSAFMDDRLPATIAAQQAAADVAAPAQEPVGERLDAIAAAIDSLTARADWPEAPVPTPLDKEAGPVLERMAADLERLLRQEQSGRLVQLVETRMGAGVDAVVQRIERLAGDLEDISAAVERVSSASTGAEAASTATLDALKATGEQVQAAVGRLEQHLGDRLDEGQSGIVASMEAIATSIDELRGRTREALTAAQGAVQQSEDAAQQVQRAVRQSADASQRTEQAVQQSEEVLRAQVRSESEQLTQRVAALAAAVERLRQSVDALAEESAQSLGKRATEVGRRLAADWGFKSRRPDATDDRERGREIGPGR